MRRIPHNKTICLTQEEAQTIYECLEADQVVSPIHFNKEIIKAPTFRRLAYQKLEELLEEEGSINPYEMMLLNPMEEMPPDPFLNIDHYHPSLNSLGKVNNQNMENWSVLSTVMHYTDPPQGHHSLMVMDCKTSILDEWDRSGKAPTVTSENIPESVLMDQFLDQFDSITTKLNMTGKFQDNRDVSTTYLGTDIITK